MVQQPVEVKIWVCTKSKPYKAFFVTRKEEEARKARKKGFKCRRWRALEEIELREQLSARPTDSQDGGA